MIPISGKWRRLPLQDHSDSPQSGKRHASQFYVMVVRVMLNVKRLDKVSNNKILESVGIKHPLNLTVQRRQLKFVGHSLRRAEDELINEYVLYTPEPYHGQRGAGRPPLLYPDYIAILINIDTPPTIKEIRRAAQNRQGWQRIVDACLPTSFAVDWWWWSLST